MSEPVGKQGSLPLGLYERLVYSDEVAALADWENAKQAIIEEPSAIQRREHLIHEIGQRLPELLDEVSGANASKSEQARLELKMIAHLLREARLQSGAATDDRMPAEPLRVLRALHAPNAPPMLPLTGLRRHWIFTSGKSDPSLLGELRTELATVDRVDILVSFITWSGVRKLLDVLKQVTALDARGMPHTRIRIMTTTYIGATEARAVNELAQLPGVELKISLDGRRTRLHAKAWLLHRKSQFGTAYVGSANLSESALIGGIEWTVKITQAADADLFATAAAHFETLWNDTEFQLYDPANEQQREALETALREQRRDPRRPSKEDEPIAIHTWFDLRPKTYQQEMLERLQYERRHGRNRNLVVAATGTGKTVVAAFDYHAQALEAGSPPRLLFIAHRIQILSQAIATFRQVLRDPAFGELLDGDNTPKQYDHLFATINTVHSRKLVESLGANYWRVVIVDEAHHLPAASFDKFVREIRPSILLGLTATPERTDGQSLNQYFDSRPDGSPAVSLRLWDALDQQLLAPFEYYATADATDFSHVKWNRIEEKLQLDAVISSNEFRARTVIDTLRNYVADFQALRALAFCVSVKHAEFMANWFTKAGLPAKSLTGTDNASTRERAIRELRAGEIKIICSCDLFNEGVDIPEINTLMLLRPTQSPVVFQQQIGRGLRLNGGKDSCLVLDFIGQYSEEFRHDILLRSITGLTRKQLKESVENGFGQLPAGCHIQFDRVAKDRVLKNLRASLNLNATRLRRELAAWAAQRSGKPIRLKEFLLENQIELADVYSGRHSWTEYKRDVGIVVPAAGPREVELSRSMGNLLHANDPYCLQAWTNALSTGEIDERRVQMLAYQILHNRNELIDPIGFNALMQNHPALSEELVEIFELLDDKSTAHNQALLDVPENWPLTLHARYSRREIQSAVGHLSSTSRPIFNEGCLPLQDQKIELLLVTLDKREGFSERVQYHDYAISPERFHWQTQNRAGHNNATGRRYLESAENGWRFQLFVRENIDSAYVALGAVILESFEGDRPISVTWKLPITMPIEIFRRFSILRES